MFMEFCFVVSTCEGSLAEGVVRQQQHYTQWGLGSIDDMNETCTSSMICIGV